jgi:hypothetical protein
MDKDNWEDFEIKFKPLNEGLGFNQGKKDPFEKKKRKEFVQSNLSTQAINLPPLDQATRKMPVKEVIENTIDDSSLSILRKLFSWIIDFSIIAFFAILMTRIIHFVEFRKSLNFFTNLDFTFFVLLPLFFFLYIFYFSMFWKCFSKTLGMSLFRLKLSSMNKEVHLGQTMLRAFLSFISIFSFGILDILGVSDMFSKTTLKNNL